MRRQEATQTVQAATDKVWGRPRSMYSTLWVPHKSKFIQSLGLQRLVGFVSLNFRGFGVPQLPHL